MLHGEDDQHQDDTDPEDGVEREADRTERAAVERPVADRGRAGCRQRSDGIGRGLADIGRVGEPCDDFGRRVTEAGDRRQRAEDIGRSDRAAERQHRRPGEPVAPHRQRCDELGITQPGGSAIDRGAARLRRKQAGNLGIGEGLDQAEDHRGYPDGEGEIAGRPGDAADREKHQRRHAAGDPEGAAPVDGSVQLAACRHGGVCGDGTHVTMSPLLRSHQRGFVWFSVPTRDVPTALAEQWRVFRSVFFYSCG